MLDFDIPSFSALNRLLTLAGLVMLSSLMAKAAPQEQAFVSMKDAIQTEVQSKGFTLTKDMKVHVYAKGGGKEDSGNPFWAYGWILNANTREVVWRMDGRTSQRDRWYQVADHYIDLPKGSYEAYFTNHSFGRNSILGSWTRNIDRRHLNDEERDRDNSHGFGRLFRNFGHGQLRTWREQAGNYGMEIYALGSDASSVQTFQAPLRWKHELISLTKVGDSGQWSQSFHVSRPTTFHVYAQGEGVGDRELVDTGWIIDAHTRKRVWEMEAAKALYGGGSTKNRRQVETIKLPAGDYVATYVTDGSHSPADWNAAPPCDPLMYGLTLSIPAEAEVAQVSLSAAKEPGEVLAELVRVRNDRDVSASFALKKAGRVRIYAIGEADGDDELADYGWIEDAQGNKVWTMRIGETRPAGGASKNRMVDELIELPKGAYTLHYRTDDSHAYGHWNNDAPWDAEHYGVTVYAVE